MTTTKTFILVANATVEAEDNHEELLKRQINTFHYVLTGGIYNEQQQLLANVKTYPLSCKELIIQGDD